MVVEGSNFPPAATRDAIASLRRALPCETPSDYFAFFERADGAQVWFDQVGPGGIDCLRIYSIVRMLELQRPLAGQLPSLLVIGGDQGSQYLAYDFSAPPPWPLVMHQPGARSAKIADSFTDLARRYFLPTGTVVQTGQQSQSHPKSAESLGHPTSS